MNISKNLKGLPSIATSCPGKELASAALEVIKDVPHKLYIRDPDPSPPGEDAVGLS